MLTLALAYLRDRPLTTALNVLLLAISVAMLVLLLQFGEQARDRLARDAQGVDLVVGAKGSPLQLILSSIFHVDEPTGNISYESLEGLRANPAIERVVPLALGDNFRGFRIVGTDASFKELYGLKLAQGHDFDAPLQVVIGSTVAEATGAEIGQKFIGSHGFASDESGTQGHDHAPFETVGILAPSGTVVDRLILTSVASVWDVHGIAHDHSDEGHEHEEHDHDSGEHERREHRGGEHGGHEHEAHNHKTVPPAGSTMQVQATSAQVQRPTGLEPELTSLLVSYRNASAAIRVPAMINRQTEMQAAVPAVETARLLELLGASLDGIRIFAWMLAVTGGLAIFVALLNMTRTREGDLALLRVMGASPIQVFATVILEGVITATVSALIGWLGAHTLIAIARSQIATLADLGLSAFSPVAGEALLVGAVVAIGALAALIPAIRVYKIDPARIMARA